jgi:hypothetical protein
MNANESILVDSSRGVTPPFSLKNNQRIQIGWGRQRGTVAGAV